MKNKMCGRVLPNAFVRDLRSGVLNPLLRRVHSDRSLEMDLRGEYLNVYYRGGSVLRVACNGTGYEAFFDQQYALVPLNLPDAQITTLEDTLGWLDRLPVLKDTMDLWFGVHPKDERATQQLVVHENNASPWAKGTDYFIVDVEYDNRRGARFDLVALRWDSVSAARKLQKSYLPTLSVIEIKTGDSAINGAAGLFGHYQQWEKFFADTEQSGAFEREMLDLFRQKRLLGLIPALKDNPNEVVRVATVVDVIFLLANHDPASRKLVAALDAIRARQKEKPPRFSLRFATATFMGFGLYSQNVLPLDNFKLQLERAVKMTE